EEGRFRPQVFAPTVEHKRRIYHAHRIVVQIPPARRRLAGRAAAKRPAVKRPAVKQAAKVVETPKPRAKVEAGAIPVARKPISYQVASLPSKVDAEPVPTENAPPPVPSPMLAQVDKDPAPQVEKQFEGSRIDQDELTLRVAYIPPGDMLPPNEPVPSIPV